MGQAPDGSTYNEQGLGLPLIAGASDLGDWTPQPSRYTSDPTQICSKGDIVLCIRATIGDRNWADREYCLGRGVAGLRARSGKLEARYLWHYLGTATRHLLDAARGATFLQVSRGDIENLRVPLPKTLSDQEHIADILDKADAIRRKRKEAIALTEDLLRSTFLEMFGDPVTNPKRWPTKPLWELAEIDRGRFTPRPRNDPRFYGGSHPFIQTGDLRSSTGYLRVWRQTLNDQGCAVSRSFARGTVAIAIAANIGDTAIVDFDFCCPDSVVGIVPRPAEATSEYLERMLRFFQPRLMAEAPETAQKNINLETLRPLRIPAVPLPQQERFGAVYRTVYRNAGRMDESTRDADVLFQSLVQQSFVAGDRTEQPC